MKISYLVGIMLAVLILPLVVGIWLPDVLFGGARTLATTTWDGYSFRVVQYWNSVDWYTTELKITDRDGRTEHHVLDGDDSLHWTLPMSFNPQHRSVSVTLKGNAKYFTY